MAYILIVYEPWLEDTDGEYSTYDAERCAEQLNMQLEAFLKEFRKATTEKGGRILYEGDPEVLPLPAHLAVKPFPRNADVS